MQSSGKPSLSPSPVPSHLPLPQHPSLDKLPSCRHEEGVKDGKRKKEEKWNREEISRWLEFVVRYVVDHPYYDLKLELAEADWQDDIYSAMRKWMGTRNGRQCEFFTKSTLLQLHRTGVSNLGAWACSKLAKLPSPSAQSLCQQYESLSQRRSRYMECLHELSSPDGQPVLGER